jgi:hypothetical protein
MPVARLLRLAGLVPFLVGLAVGPFVMNAVISAQHLPPYASWTGIAPLEEKLQKLGDFASHGQVDGLVLGSSISDFGFDARLLSQEISTATGKPYRVFNFSTGGAEMSTMPTLYRLARTVSKPHTLLLAWPEEVKRPETGPGPRSPDYTLEHAPVGTAMAHPWLFPLERRVWDVPLVRDAAAFRDRLVFGQFKHVPVQGSDLYSMDAWGDTRSFYYQTRRGSLTFLREAHRTMLVPLTPREMATFSEREKLQHYFSNYDIKGMDELLRLAQADGCPIVIIAHEVAADFYRRPLVGPTFARTRRQYFAILAHHLKAKLVYEVGKFAAKPYMITDPEHLNVYGSQAFTHLVAEGLTHRRLVSTPALAAPPLPDQPSGNPTISPFAALVKAPPQAGMLVLRLRLMRNHSVPPVPDAPLKVALRLPSGRDVIGPARLTSRTSLVARFTLPPGRNQLYYARILYEGGGRLNAPNQPISAYSWTR